MNNEEFEGVIVQVKTMLNTSEKISPAENYVTALYANGKISTRQFDLLSGIIYQVGAEYSDNLYSDNL